LHIFARSISCCLSLRNCNLLKRSRIDLWLSPAPSSSPLTPLPKNVWVFTLSVWPYATLVPSTTASTMPEIIEKWK
jgi:hypothetical protein